MIGVKLEKFNRARSGAKAGARPGFSLIEIIVSVGLFSVIILSATQIFKMVIDNQRNALAAQNVQESLKYFFEVTGKEMRMAQKNQGTCAGIPDEKIFLLTTGVAGQKIMFRNYYNQCVTYELAPDGDSQRFQITRNTQTGYISPQKIKIDNLYFILREGVEMQSIVTMNLRAHALNAPQLKSDMIIQTSITSRNYK